MPLLTHVNQINQQLPDSPLKSHIQTRFDSLAFETDVPPNHILVEEGDIITGPNFAFINADHGLLGDLWDEHEPGHPDFCRPYEWVSYWPSLALYEVLLLVNNEDGYWILIPETVVDSHPDLHWVLTAEELGGLSEPQPLY